MVEPGKSQPELPANFVLGMETGMRVLKELSDGTSLDDALAKRREELREILAPIDAVHLLGQLLITEGVMFPESYSESESSGQAYVIELVAAELLLRPGRAGTRAETPAIDAHTLDPLRKLCQEAASIEGFRRYPDAEAAGRAEGAARGRAATHHLYLRNPGWPWQEHETLLGLFGEDRFAQRLRDEVGFEVEEAIRCAEALPELFGPRTEAHMTAARESSADFGPQHPAYRWAEAVFDDKWKTAPEAEAALYIPGVWAMNRFGEALLITPAELAEAASVDQEVAVSYLSTLSLSFGQPDDGWFRLAERLRERPFIEVERDTYMLTVPGADLWAIRSLFEGVLKSEESYLEHRGKWLERQASELLKAVLRPDEVHRSLHYEATAEDGSLLQGEIDVLLRLGSTAILVEAKSASMRPGARRGGEAFIKHLRENLTKAAKQGTRAGMTLGRDPTLRTPDGSHVELGSQINEVHHIAVTLDDLSAVAPVVWELAGTKVMPAGLKMPWVITLHELDLVTQTIEWPAQLVHFLRRRSRLNEIGGLAATDELDWWMHYLSFGLHFEDKATRERIRFTSLTDPLDAWVLHDRGLRQTPAPRPMMSVPRGTRDFLELICAERPEGWVQAACTMLNPHHDAQAGLWKDLKKMRKQARQRKKVQRRMLAFKHPEPMMICAVVAPAEAEGHLADSLAAYVGERLEEEGRQRVLGIGSVVTSKRPYDALLVLEPVCS
jgi:hypothetical protein